MTTRRQLLLCGAAGASLLWLPSVSSPAGRGGDAPVLTTTNGKVRGFSDNGIAVFRGIRYGADTRPRRFMPPLTPQRWDSIVDTVEYGHAAPQPGSDEKVSEDCLFLNVWTPAGEPERKRPVMVYLHGGAYASGSGASPQYDGCYLARNHDVVVVTINHRLNAFGYLYLRRFGNPRFADSGNCGQLDLLLALRWIRQNIGAFGGDPERVLTFGQSGGGAKIATLMAMPASKGLFHRVATMSGQQVTASGPHNATKRSEAFLDAIGLAPSEIDKLVKLPMETLLNGLSASDPILPYGRIYFGPVLDMRSLQRHPFYPDAAPQSASIPMIIGNTHDETRAFLRGADYQNLTWAELPDLLIPNMRVDIRPEFVIAEYRRLYPKLSPTEVFFKATTAARSWRGAIIEAEARARQNGAATYVYQLDFASPLQPELGAPHTFDIALVFGNLDAPGSLTGTGRKARAVSTMMGDAFATFARTGIPRSEHLPDWTPYRLPQRNTLIIDNSPKIVSDPRGAERELFSRVPYVQPGT